MSWFQFVIREPDPRQLVEAQRLGSQTALGQLIAILQRRLGPHFNLPAFNTATPEACADALADALSR